MNSDHQHDHGHDHAHGHAHGHGAPAGRRWPRLVVAGALVAVAALAATLGVVRQGSAVVITRFGDPVRVHTTPGLAWRLPAPIERATEIDLRLHTTVTGLHDVGTKDGLRVTLSASAAWRVAAEPARILQHLRAVRGDADEAAAQLRTLLGSALEIEASRFALTELRNTDPAQVRLAALEDALRERLRAQLAENHGIEVMQVGIVRLGLPESTVKATIERMSAERMTAAEEKRAAGRKLAEEIRQGADRERRIVVASAEEEASKIEAAARSEASAIYGKAHAADPTLYAFLRGLDALDQVIKGDTRIVLRTDAAPFRALVELPTAPAGAAPAPATGNR
jgi:membrane protease subunit HflC